MKIIIQTPALRCITKKLTEVISDVDSKIVNSPVLGKLFGVEKKRTVIVPFMPRPSIDIRDIKPFLKQDLIERVVKTSIDYEKSRRERSSLAEAAYKTPEGCVESLLEDMFLPNKDSMGREVMRRLMKNKG
jgi:hypothetical protein